MHRVVKWDILEFMRPHGTNKWILLFDLRQDFLDFFVMYETDMPRVNGIKYFQRGSIELCEKN